MTFKDYFSKLSNFLNFQNASSFADFAPCSLTRGSAAGPRWGLCSQIPRSSSCSSITLNQTAPMITDIRHVDDTDRSRPPGGVVTLLHYSTVQLLSVPLSAPVTVNRYGLLFSLYLFNIPGSLKSVRISVPDL